MHIHNDSILTAEQIFAELEQTSSAHLTVTYSLFEQYVEKEQFKCMEEALYKLYSVGVVDGCVV